MPTIKDTRPTQLDKLHALVEHLEDHPGLSEHDVLRVGGLYATAAAVDVQVHGTDVAAIVAWARSIGARTVSLRAVDGDRMHLHALGKLAPNVPVDVVLSLPLTAELADLGDTVPVEQLERPAPEVAEVDPAVRERALAALDEAGKIARRIAKAVR